MSICTRLAGLASAFVSLNSFAASAPVAFYTDLDSAPNGAFVTVWGKAFGTTAGTVSVGSAVASGSDIITWSDSKIELKLPIGAGNGIAVRNVQGSSNTLPFTTRATGRIFYVSTATGNNANAGTSAASPWKDLTAIMPNVKGGDVVYVRAGVYTELQDTGWGASILVRPENSGSPGMPVAVVAYPGESVTLGSGSNRRAFYTSAYVTDWTFAKFKVAAYETAVGGTGARIRIVGNSASNIASPYGTFEFTASDQLSILGNGCTGCGAQGNKLAHSYYYGGYGAGSAVEIAWNTSVNQQGGRGIQIYGHTATDSLTGLSIHDNTISGTPYDCILVGLSDATTDNWIRDAVVYNNVVSNCGAAGIQINNPGMSVRVLHNTVYNAANGLNLVAAGTTEVANNIFANAKSQAIGTSPSLSVSNNGYSAVTVPAAEKVPVVGDPLFVNAAAGDFSLGTTSPFLGKGKVLSPALPTVSVPTMVAPDLGAVGWKSATAVIAPKAPQTLTVN